jgi:glycosyltransferase involved in cell wall biosynthesis
VKLAAVMTVRNEADILPINIAYHRSMGVSDFWIVDNGSTDGTAHVLRSIAEENDWLRWRSEPGEFHQSTFVSALAQEAFAAGVTWVVPIDADEFWWTRSDESLALALGRCKAGSVVCQVENFVQSATVSHDHEAALETMTFRAESVGSVSDARELVESEAIAFVEMTYPPKLLHRSSSELIIGDGNHSGVGYVGDEVLSADIKVLHAPIRSKARLRRLAEHGRRSASVNPDLEHSWHLRRWAEMEADGHLEGEWVANSHRDGELMVGGQRRGLTRDHRLALAVSPFVPQAGRWLSQSRSTVG